MYRFTKPFFRMFGTVFKYVCFDLPRYQNKKKHSYQKRYNRAYYVLNKLSKALDVDLHISGLENLPKEKGYCLFPNHVGAYDSIIMINLIKDDLALVGKQELKDNIIARNAMNSIDCLFLNRDDLKESLKTMKIVEESLKNKEHNWAIYPEGKRNKDPNHILNPFHHGSFRSAVKAKAPIVPIATYGSQRVLRTKIQYNKYPVHVSVLPPLYPKDYEGKTTEEIARIVSDMIQREITFNIRRLDNIEMKKVKRI